MTLFATDIQDLTMELCSLLELLSLDERVAALNDIRQMLHGVSPFNQEPVDCVQWFPAEKVVANDYNPNHVAPPEMRLLERSIVTDGYTQPIVGSADGDTIETVDGFHRGRIGKESKKVRQRTHGYLPVALIRSDRADRSERIAATIRHNRARGVHGVVPMTGIITELIRRGLTDAEVAAELGMDADEVLRFKQTSGLPELFRDADYSRAWE